VFVFSRTDHLPKRKSHYFDNHNHLHGFPRNKRRFNDDIGPSSTPLLAPLRLRVGDKVGAEVPSMAEAMVPQDDSGSDGWGSDYLGSDDNEGSGSDDGEDKAMHIPFRMTSSGSTWYMCPICIGEEYDSDAKVVLHALEVIKHDVVERYHLVL
jgi:hypothetical protein